MDLLAMIELEDLKEEQQEVAELIGLDTYKKLIKSVGGSFMYIPKENTICVKARNKIIRKEFDGNYKKIGRKYRLSEKQVRNIISEN